MLDRFSLWLAWRLPRRLVKWCFVRVCAHATTGRWSHQVVPDLGMMDALRRWDEPNEPLAPGLRATGVLQ